MTSNCPTCGAVLRAPEQAIGKTCKCPKCAARFVVEEARPSPAEPAVPTIPDPPLVAPAVARRVAMKECPFCCTAIPAEAKRCRECGEIVDVVMRVAEDAREAAEDARREARRARHSGGVNQQVVVHGGPTYRSFPHGLHLVLTLFTCGAWLPIWLIHWIIWECC